MSTKMKMIVGGILCTLCSVASAETSVSLSQSAIRANVGDVVSVNIQMSGFPITEGGGIDMHYDPTIVRVNSVVVDGNTWNFVNANGEIDNAQGVVSGVLFSSYQGVMGSANVATVELQIVGKGRCRITLSESERNPFASNSERIAVTYNPTDIRTRR